MIKRTKKLLPKICANRPKWRKKIVAEYLVTIHPKSKLKVKVLVFDKHSSLREFFTTQLKRVGDICQYTKACCTNNSWQRVEDDGTVSEVIYDRNIAAILCLIEGRIDLEVISHECVHAASCFAERTHLRWPYQDEQPEESIAYPVGRLTHSIAAVLLRDGYLTIPTE